MSTPGDDRTLENEKARLERTGRLGALHWAVVGASLGITLLAWHASSTALQARVLARFEHEAERVVELFTDRLQRHADMLHASAGWLSARGEDVTHPEWKRYLESLQLPELYPGLVGINVLNHVRTDQLDAFLRERQREYPDFALHPPHDQPFHLPVMHSSVSRDDPALGFDMAHDAVRRDGVKRALLTGRAQITAPIELTYSRTRGLLMFVPFYRGDENGWQRTGRDGMAGAMLAIMRTKNLADGVLDRDKRRVSVRISDADRTLYDEHDGSHDGADTDPLHSLTLVSPVFGRDWRFDIESTAAFRRDAASIEPWVVLAGGLLIDALLLALFAMLSRANRRALRYADDASAELRRRSAALAQSNEVLESFAYVASHDLKTPLNGIRSLADFIEEDLEALAADEDTLPDINRNIGRIRQQVRRGQALIGGILEYAGLDNDDPSITTVDTRTLLLDIVDGLDAGGRHTLVLEGEFPVLQTSETRLTQVLGNLVGNAFKYHHDPANALVRVQTQRIGDFHRFSVHDDGPGIEPVYHERIFELFKTLGGRDDVDSTGVGLSIVKKVLDGVGGSIRVDSAPGLGTSFTFDWPVCIDTAVETNPSLEPIVPLEHAA